MIVLFTTIIINTITTMHIQLTCRPPRNHPDRAVHRRHDLPAHPAELRVGQPPHPVHQRVQVLDHRPDRRHVGRHLERPVLPVLAALVQVLAVRPVAGDDVQRFAHDEVLERGGVHFFLFCFLPPGGFLGLVGFPFFSGLAAAALPAVDGREVVFGAFVFFADAGRGRLFFWEGRGNACG